eukprot:1966057-Rhodomonas_salina.4
MAHRAESQAAERGGGHPPRHKLVCHHPALLRQVLHLHPPHIGISATTTTHDAKQVNTASVNKKKGDNSEPAQDFCTPAP